ncbi:hypothetical protein DPMN_073951 [Dreissena polymorpha]|uniref:Uncharacterized protein n=1 Tax=Dreissena polymorpha TaxID=45954 RepID=A0A9D3YHG4_DREPO|nr:hypothetical protein DPMN_073951 [Dreissena polymorpha]
MHTEWAPHTCCCLCAPSMVARLYGRGCCTLACRSWSRELSWKLTESSRCRNWRSGP